LLSFKKIRFGNFSLLGFKDVSKILRDKNIWNAFPPTLSLNLNKMSFITINRENRYSGLSKMNYLGLFYHALRVFSVLRIRIFFSSIAYISFLFLTLQNKFLIIFFIYVIFFAFINILNFSLFVFNKKNFEKRFREVKIIKI
jgi:hypothetical protein